MAYQSPVNITTGANWIQPTEPPLVERNQGNVWIDNADPQNQYMKTWDGANWVVNGLLKANIPVPPLPPPPSPPISTYGIAGYIVSFYSNMVVDKLTYSTETTTALGSFGISNNVAVSCGLSNLSNGWNIGSNGPIITRKVTFSSEALSTIAATTSPARHANGTGVSNVPAGKGYVIGGTSGTLTNKIDRFTFSSQTFSASAQNLTQTVHFATNTQSTTNGYNMTGTGASSSLRTNIHRLVLATEAVALISANTTIHHAGAPGLNGSTNGYVFDSQSDTIGGYSSIIDRLTFSSETVASIAQTTTQQTLYSVGVQARTKAFICGGNGLGTAIKRFSFTTETLTAISAVLTVAQFGYYGRLGEDLN